MAELRESLKVAAQNAMRSRNQVALDSIRMVQSAIKNKEIEKRSALSDTEIMQVIAALCKQRRESIGEFKRGGRDDLVAKETQELKVLEAFLPEQLGPDEVEQEVRAVIAQVGAKSAKDMGLVMKPLREKLAGRVDGKFLSETVQRLLQGS